MGSIRRTKTKRRTRDLDQIHADIKSPKHLAQYKVTKAAEDLPGLGKFYCVECSRWFEGEHNLKEHKRGKNHKRRVRLLKEKPYSQKEAEAAKIDLFGGAMEAEYPSSFFDISDIRQVPDHQECFADRENPDYFNVEILERVDDEKSSTDKAAFRFHATDVTDEGEFVISDPSSVTLDMLPTSSLLGFCEGKASSTNRYTGIIVLLIRLKEKHTDLLVSMILQELDAARDRFENGQGQSGRFQHAATVMNHFRETFKIKDWDLFA